MSLEIKINTNYDALPPAQKLQHAVSMAINHSATGGNPLYGIALMISRVATKSIPTMAVGYNRHMHRPQFFYNPDFVKVNKLEFLAECIKHEALHLILAHIDRCVEREPKKWNIATDMAINCHLNQSYIKEGFVVVQEKTGEEIKEVTKKFNTVLPSLYNLKDGLSADAYYDLLPDITCGKNCPFRNVVKPKSDIKDPSGDEHGEGEQGKDNEPENGSGQNSDGCGGCKENNKDGEGNTDSQEGSNKTNSENGGDGCGGCQSNSSGEGEEQGDNYGGEGCSQCPVSGGSHEFWRQIAKDSLAKQKIVQLRKEAANQIGKYAGSLPGNLVDQIIAANRSVVDWRNLLRKFVQLSLFKDLTTTRKKLNKRFGLMSPGFKKNPAAKMAVIIDTSGSVSDNMLKQFSAEINNIIPYAGSVREIQFDTQVNIDREVTNKITTWTIGGRGGTNITPAIELINKQKYDAVVILSDFYFFEVPPVIKSPSIWVGVPSCDKNFRPIRGKVIVMDEFKE